MTAQKLDVLRKVMRHHKIDAYIIPSTDPHQSEYLPNYWKTREWLTGFTGSAGVAVVTQKQALLWTDSRYFIQAEAELNPPFQLVKQQTRNPEYIEWLNSNLKFSDIVGIDGDLFSHSLYDQLVKSLASKQIKVNLVGDLFRDIWQKRPELPVNPIFEHDEKLAGESRRQKIDELVSLLKLNGASYLIITTLDDIAWLLNLRGADISFNPVFLSYCIVTVSDTFLFIDENKINESLRLKLKKDKITILPYDAIYEMVSKMKDYTNILVDADSINQSIRRIIPAECRVISQSNIVAKYKAVKNEVQINEYHQAQKFDGIAMCTFINWMEQTVSKKNITEIDAATMMEKIRSAQPGYQGLSFPVISAYGANAALPHYLPGKRSNATIENRGVYLVDCGSQYLNGTTDITRTLGFGEVEPEIKDTFTYVLKAHIALATAIFPKGTKGYQLDSLARAQMWKHGIDYGHGTGHGIGYFLNVHEGPHGLSVQSNGPAVKIIEPGMLITNEPGAYFEGKYGIRIENVLLCVPAFRQNNIDYLKFETLSLCPIDKKMINKSLLNDQEIDWLNRYHQKIFQTLSPVVCQEVKSWLEDNTLPLIDP